MKKNEDPYVTHLDKSSIHELVRQMARDRELDTEKVYSLIEESLAKLQHRINDRKGNYTVTLTQQQEHFDVTSERIWEVIDNDQPIEDTSQQKTLEAALEIDKDAQIGGEIKEKWIAPDLDKHTNAKFFKDKYLTLMRQAESSKLLDDLLERGDKLINGTVKRTDRSNGDLIIEVQRVECRLRRQDIIPKETLRKGDRIRCLIKEIKEDANRGRVVHLTRTSDLFLRELFYREVPEIEKGIIEIIGVTRDPGYRAKIAVHTKDPRVDPVGTCVGMRGSRVQSVTADLAGEKVDIINWDEDEMKFVLSALAPAEIETIRIVGDKSCDVIVKEEKLPKAIGKNGMNVKLASRLTGWKINISNSEDADEREQERADRKQKHFMENLNVDEDVARILYDEGFDSINDIINTTKEEFLEIEGFTEEIVDAIINRAKEVVEKNENQLEENLAKADDKLKELITDAKMLETLVTNGVLTVETLAEEEYEDLLEKLDGISEKELDKLIFNARASLGWFDEDEEDEEESEVRQAASNE